MTKETLQSDLEKVLKRHSILYTRLRTPRYGYRGVRYPADYVVWTPVKTCLVECKQRKKLPIAPSDIRQLPFMREWKYAKNRPQAEYFLLTATEEGYCIFSFSDVVEASECHCSLKKDGALIHDTSLESLLVRFYRACLR